MKVLALNSSPRMGKGSTAAILTPLLEGMAQEGADVELVYVHQLDIKPCLGCFTCWTRTPGRCVQRDDMDDLLPKLAAADTLVMATPLYVDGMTSTMKAVLDRTIPGAHPFIEIRDDRCRHPAREPNQSAKLLLVSVSGFTELANFDALIVHAKAICENMGREYAGALLRPAAWALQQLGPRGLPVDDVFQAAREAGRQLARDGAISPDTLGVVSRELAPRQVLVDALNGYFQRALDAAKA